MRLSSSIVRRRAVPGRLCAFHLCSRRRPAATRSDCVQSGGHHRRKDSKGPDRPGPGDAVSRVAVRREDLQGVSGLHPVPLEQNFNPKAGTLASVKGYQNDSDITAITVTLAGEKKTLRLRDDNGYPLWRGGMMMRRMRPRMNPPRPSRNRISRRAMMTGSR